jgi:hypothetical protein
VERQESLGNVTTLHKIVSIRGRFVGRKNGLPPPVPLDGVRSPLTKHCQAHRVGEPASKSLVNKDNRSGALFGVENKYGVCLGDGRRCDAQEQQK